MERTYTIPLRKEFQKAPSYKHTAKAVRATKEFLKKHMKAGEVKLGKYLNELMWKNGPKNPPHKVKVVAKKEDNIVKAELVGAPEEKKKEAPKKKSLKGLTKRLKEQPAEEKKEETKAEEKPTEEPKEEKPKKVEPQKEEKIPTTSELIEQQERKAKAKEIPTAAELKDSKK